LTSSALQVRKFDPEQWAEQAAREVQGAVASVLSENGQCSVMLTGGTSAKRLYRSWAMMKEFVSLRGVRFYFGDERCVSPDHADSNYGMALRFLFADGVPETCCVLRVEAEDSDRDGAASRYGAQLPERIDVLLLGVGEDGHIASLFPGSSTLMERSRRVIHTLGPKRPFERLTITPPVVEGAKFVFVLAPGRAKADVLAKVFQKPGDVMGCPACMVLRGTWLLDSPLGGADASC
jgi:6-phosphogluconolactonase